MSVQQILPTKDQLFSDITQITDKGQLEQFANDLKTLIVKIENDIDMLVNIRDDYIIVYDSLTNEQKTKYVKITTDCEIIWDKSFSVDHDGIPNTNSYVYIFNVTNIPKKFIDGNQSQITIYGRDMRSHRIITFIITYDHKDVCAIGRTVCKYTK